MVAKYIDDKTAVDDRRYSLQASETIVVVNMALSVSYAGLYRTCKSIAESQGITNVPSYPWFLLQFWPTSKSQSALASHTGRFKVKRMVQARVLRKYNPDFHYANAVFSFLKRRAKSNAANTSFITADAKCKVQIGEPGFPIAAVARGKKVLVGVNEVMSVADHDFSKLSLIPDAILVHDIPGNSDFDLDANVDAEAVGAWYRGQVHYGIKNMANEGSTAIRGAVEIAEGVKQHISPERLYCYTDGGGDRNVVHLAVQKAIVAIFLALDLEEAIFCRTAANCSFRNPVERVHAIANIGLQAVGLMRTLMDEASEDKIKRANGNVDIRALCEDDSELEECIKKSLERPKQLIENVLRQLSLKDKEFKIFDPVSDDTVDEYKKKRDIFYDGLDALTKKADLHKFPVFKEFLRTHCVRRTFSSQVTKCSDNDCVFHTPLRSGPIADFPDPIPFTDDDGVERYKEGVDAEEKSLPSKLLDVTKQHHGLPFSPSAQTARNTMRTVKCSECSKPRLVHAARKLKEDQKKNLRRVLGNLRYVP